MLRNIIQIFFLSFLALSHPTYAQTVVAFQGGEGSPADNWSFIAPSNAGGPLPPGIVNTYPRTGTRSLRAGGGNNSGCSGGANCIVTGQATGCAMHGKRIEFAAVNVACLSDVQISCYHRSHIFCSGSGFDSGEGLNFEVNLNGSGWILVGTLRATGDYAWSYLTNPAGNVTTVPNPFVYNVPAGTNTVAFRVTGLLNRSDEVYYLDDVKLTTSTTTYGIPGTAGLWNGAVNTDWHNACNWDSRFVPTPATDVLLPAGAINNCEVFAGSIADCRDLTIEIPSLAVESFTSTINVYGNMTLGSTGYLDMSLSGTEGGTMNLHGDWINNRDETFFDQGLSTVNFTGTGNQLITSLNDSKESFFKMRVSKSSGTLTTSEDLWIDPMNAGGATPMLILNNGLLDLNGKEIKIWNDQPASVSRTGGGIISERTDNTSRITRVTGSTTGNFIFPLVRADGTYIPFIFNQTAGNAGAVTVATYPTAPNNLPWPSTPAPVFNLTSSIGLSPDNRDATVDRFWQIDVTGLSTANLTFSYGPSELPPSPFDNPLTLGAQRYDGPTDFWQPYLPGQGANYFFVYVPGVSEFSTWTLTNNLSPLPVDLLSFDAKLNDLKKVDLKWITASEINNDFFTLEKSQDGESFRAFATVKGAGTSSIINTYSSVDDQPYSGISYYRLKQTDYDGTYKYSPLARINNNSVEEAALSIYPNPASDHFYVVKSIGFKSGKLTLYDLSGKAVHSQHIRHEESEANTIVRVDIRELSPGIYFLKTTEGEILKIVIQ